MHAPVSGGTIPSTKISKNRVFSPNGACTTMRGKGVYKDIPAEDEWKVQGAKELIEAKHDTSILPNFSTEVLQDYFTT